MSSCCPPDPPKKEQKLTTGCCPSEEAASVQESGGGGSCGSSKKRDKLLWGSVFFIFLGYALYFVAELGVFGAEVLPLWVTEYSSNIVSIFNKMWLGMFFALFFVGGLHFVPREIIMSILGTKRGFGGLFRATAAGLLLDLCNHGILVVGMKLYERGASLGQTVAFLVASPWNSFSLTLILFGLIGWSKTLIFIGLSCVIAFISGFIFDWLVASKVLPSNPNTQSLPEDFSLKREFARIWGEVSFRPRAVANLLIIGLKDSRMVLRWIFFGTVMAAVLRVAMDAEQFQAYFGPSMVGLGLTLLSATIIEVCSEGSVPIAADLVTIAKAPGNAFTFLMAGASTDYTEIIAMRETMKSWKIALFLPLVTLPQILLLGYLLNSI